MKVVIPQGGAHHQVTVLSLNYNRLGDFLSARCYFLRLKVFQLLFVCVSDINIFAESEQNVLRLKATTICHRLIAHSLKGKQIVNSLFLLL